MEGILDTQTTSVCCVALPVRTYRCRRKSNFCTTRRSTFDSTSGARTIQEATKESLQGTTCPRRDLVFIEYNIKGWPLLVATCYCPRAIRDRTYQPSACWSYNRHASDLTYGAECTYMLSMHVSGRRMQCAKEIPANNATPHLTADLR